ncbi:MAG: glycosyltransferase family 39 protein [Chloroflexota bacterium]
MRLKDGGSVQLWLACLSLAIGLAATVAVLDRTTLQGLSRQWLAALVACSLVTFAWWTRPRVERGRIRLASYEPVSLLWATAPLLLASLVLVGASYLSEEAHNYLFAHFHYRRLLSDRSWPVAFLAAAVLGYAGLWALRDLLLRLGSGVKLPQAAKATLAATAALLPVGAVFVGLLLATASLSTINVNFWRYWATADGWVATGHYPSTFTDAVQVVKGGGSPHFVSYPVLPMFLTASYSLLGHNTLAAHLPIIAGNVVLPLAVFLVVREITRNPLIGFSVAMLTASFPLLRSYTMDVAEADGLLMTTLLLAGYFSLKANRKTSGLHSHLGAGVLAGVAALARPEGVFYMSAMFLLSLKEGWRDRGFWVSVLAFACTLLGFSAILFREYGVLWPDNYRFSATISASSFLSTLQVAGESQVFDRWASASGMSPVALGGVMGLTLILVLASAIEMLRKDLALLWMPVAALGNLVMALAVGPIPAEAGKFHDFFRHISYGFPLLAVTLAYGTNEVYRSLSGHWGQLLRSGIVLGLAALVLAELHLLAGPVTPGSHTGSPIMTSDVHVMATELLVNPYPLPVMEFRLSDGRYVPDAEEYMAGFPDDVNQRYANADVRLVGNAVEYYRAAAALFLGFLVIGALSNGVSWWEDGISRHRLRRPA